VPLYEYSCPKCGRFELLQRFSDSVLSVCPTCGSQVQKVISAPAIQFKGTGWYVTDYAGKSGSSEKGSSKPENGASAAAKDSTTTSTPTQGSSQDSSATGSSPSK
jgi:putative FmdB family regulatory protein